MKTIIILALTITISILVLQECSATTQNNGSSSSSSSSSSSEEETKAGTKLVHRHNFDGEQVQLRPAHTEMGPPEEMKSPRVLSRRRRFLCDEFTGDQLCFAPPFSLRCRCGAAGCFMGKCTCNQCGFYTGYSHHYPPSHHHSPAENHSLDE
ncbi:hypothetical protein DdX_10223 [Ditylenchus destructor]|uniref:Uncharacterized protein n=1 Tax=Ditylenchus destructor TaxID=166010 RepID=A0AAD4N1F6_9BILA|nr:hypothetical protein DdX_10223 [Ditylenchus destructor]